MIYQPASQPAQNLCQRAETTPYLTPLPSFSNDPRPILPGDRILLKTNHHRGWSGFLLLSVLIGAAVNVQATTCASLNYNMWDAGVGTYRLGTLCTDTIVNSSVYPIAFYENNNLMFWPMAINLRLQAPYPPVTTTYDLGTYISGSTGIENTTPRATAPTISDCAASTNPYGVPGVPASGTGYLCVKLATAAKIYYGYVYVDSTAKTVTNLALDNTLPTFYPLTTNAVGNGTVTGAGNYAAGQTVTLGATPTSCFFPLTGWAPSPCAASFTMPASALTCTATFSPTPPPPVPTTPGAITTIAGSCLSSGSIYDGSLATLARLNNPFHVALDSNGNLYIADRMNDRIRKVDATTGIISTVAGGVYGFGGDNGIATNAQLRHPTSVAFDQSNNLYIADTFNYRVRKVDATTQIINTVAGIGTPGYNNDGIPATSAQLNSPEGVAVDKNGNLYIADSNNNRIRKVDATTQVISTVAGTGTAGFSGDGGVATNAKLNQPKGITLDSNNNLYIADSTNHCVRKLDATTGIISTVAGTAGTAGSGGDGGPAINAPLNSPSGVALDNQGNLYIADTGNNRLRKVDTTGTLSTVAGTSAGFSGDGGLATSAQLNSPSGVTLDSSGNLYIADKGNNRIRKVLPLINATYQLTLATTGTGTGTVSSTGTPAGTSCGANCFAYPNTTAVTLMATPDTGASFNSWNCTPAFTSGNPLTANTTCTATFSSGTGTTSVTPTTPVTPPTPPSPPPLPTKVGFFLKVDGNGSGTVTTDAGVSCQTSDCHSVSFDVDASGVACNSSCQTVIDNSTGPTVVTLTPQAAAGSYFAGWGGHPACVNGQLTVAEGRLCIAFFDNQQAALFLTLEGTGQGQVAVNVGNLNWTSNHEAHATYDVGTQVTLTATALPGSYFVGWGGDADCVAGKVNMQSDRACVAHFNLNAEPTHSLPTEANPISLQPNPPAPVTTTPTVPATPTAPPTTTETIPTAVVAQAIVPAPVTLMTAKLGPGNLHSDPAGIECGTTCQASYPSGTVVTLTATPTAGATFKEWSGDCNSPELTITVTPKTDIHCQATFVAATPVVVAPPRVPVTPPEPVTTPAETAPNEPVTTPVATPTPTPVAVTSPPVVTLLPVLIAGANFNCSPTGDIGEVCNYGGREVTNLDVLGTGIVSNGVVTTTVVNHGWISNFHLMPTGKLSGGVVTGYIVNEGVMLDFEFVGMSIIGGTLGGVIQNHSRVGGYFQDVTLLPNTKITGGILSGIITGDKKAPAVLENVRVKGRSKLSGVKLGKNVKLEKGVLLEEKQ